MCPNPARAPFVGCGRQRQPRRLATGARSAKAALMSEEALNSATARLEQAIIRIERASRARDSAGSGLAEALAALEARHGTLRERVQETIERLDVLIGDEGPR